MHRFFLDILTSHMLINSTINSGSVSFVMHVHSILTLTLFHFPFTNSDLPTIPQQPPRYACIRLFLPTESNNGRAFTAFISFKTNM